MKPTGFSTTNARIGLERSVLSNWTPCIEPLPSRASQIEEAIEATTGPGNSSPDPHRILSWLNYRYGHAAGLADWDDVIAHLGINPSRIRLVSISKGGSLHNVSHTYGYGISRKQLDTNWDTIGGENRPFHVEDYIDKA
jgi:hypothetical protein